MLILFTWVQRPMVSFVTSVPHNHSQTQPRHQQNIQDSHQNVPGKVTCRDSSSGRKTTGKSSTGHGRGSHGKRSHMLSESRQVNFGISITNITPHTVRSRRQPVDYVSLNDFYEDEMPEFPKRRRKE